MRQPGKGKGDAVRKGFAEAQRRHADDPRRRSDRAARGDAEILQCAGRRHAASSSTARAWSIRWKTGRCGSSISSPTASSPSLFSCLLNQRFTDTLCGTKALWRNDYEQIAANRGYFGDFDPFGDFDLIFGAAKLNLKIVEMPVRYADRTYGETQISRFRHGWLLHSHGGIRAGASSRRCSRRRSAHRRELIPVAAQAGAARHLWRSLPPHGGAMRARADARNRRRLR